MKKTTYYNAELPEVELEIFINIKEEITFSMTDGTINNLSQQRRS